ncbi:MAG: heavy metal translocating P-type ATPase [Bacteriovoracaceae bacterium]|nr:heavy metal translocating P-type ATPase [Bacteriovoracaceae bacterium]
MPAQIALNLPAQLACVHCDGPVLIAIYDHKNDLEHSKPFCCHGCLTVYQILQLQGLDQYYDIKNQMGAFRRRTPVEVEETKYLYIDDEEFLKEYSYQNSHDDQVMEFYLEGIHCLACLWLIEKLPLFVSHVNSSRLDLSKSVAVVTLDKSGKFSSVAQQFNQLGYRPHPLKKNQESNQLKMKEERQNLLRIGIAAAGANNVMLYAISIYVGATDVYARAFSILSVLFALPVLTYSAFPFYKNAWQSLKNKTFSIDLPISVSLLLGFGMGLFHFFQGMEDNYFDSLTALVFLLLLSRYFLKKIQENALSTQDLHYFYLGESVLRAKNETLTDFEEIHSKYLSVGDRLKIPAGHFISADGKIIRGDSYLNTSLLTGESAPVKVGPGDLVLAGTQNVSSEIIMEASKVKNETRLGGILKNVENGRNLRAPIVEWTDIVSKYFIIVVFALSAGLFAYHGFFHGNFKLAVEQSLVLLIVTCPCALALSVPLTFTRSLGKAAAQGIMIKNDATLQKVSEVKSIFLDKTGTITHGKMEVVNFKLVDENFNTKKLFQLILTLEQNSKHPAAYALLNFAHKHGTTSVDLTDYRETPGVGVEGNFDGKHYQINREGFFEDGKLIAEFSFTDTVRSDSKSIIQNLLNRNFNVQLLSGDKFSVVKEVAKVVGLNESRIRAMLSPEEKNRIILETPRSMMVGDGANDAIALANAHVGVAMHGSMDISLRAADIYLSTPGLKSVEKIIILSQETMKVIKRNLILSLAYNSVSIFLAMSGKISPLAAALIMPMSSLTVLLSAFIGTKKLRALWK